MATTAEMHIHAKDHTAQAFAAVRKNIDGVTHHLSHLKKELWALVGVAGFGALVEHTIEAGAEMEKLSKKLGTSTEALSQFKFVAEASHVSFDALTRSWQLLEKNVASASAGLGPAQKALQALGLSARSLKQLDVSAQFEVLSDAMRQVHNASERGRLAMQLFGKAGAEMLPILLGGSKALHALREEADRLGLTLTESAAHQMTETHEALVRLKSAFHGVANSVAMYCSPAIATVAGWLSHALPSAVQKTLAAFVLLQLKITFVFANLLAALEGVYRLLGQLPAALGAPFREAATAAHHLNEQLLGFAERYEKILASLRRQSSAGHHAIAEMAQRYATLYDPALQALTRYHRQASKISAAQKADHLAWLQAMREQERQLQSHVEKIHSLFESGFFAFMEDGFKGMAASFKNTLMQMASQAAATELTQHLLGNPLSSSQKGSGFFETLLGGSIGPVLKGLFGGFRASGGSVLAGKGYIVGERGPEWFVPRQPGHVFSNTHVSTAAPSPPISIVMHVHTPDAGSFRHASGQITAALGVALQQAVKRNT